MLNISQKGREPEAGKEVPDRPAVGYSPLFLPERHGRHCLIYLSVLAVAVGTCAIGLSLYRQSVDLSGLSETVGVISDSVRRLAGGSGHAVIDVTGEQVMRVSNPASVNCGDAGGQLAVAKRPDGAEYGLCLFGPDRQCEEWALFRGECPVGGIDISQYGHPADVYCVVTGHELTRSLVFGSSGKCLVDGVTCSASEFFETGSCTAE
ncbi:DUF333 domain-containing protein [Candidatus Uhrbacteria bacterium]|nr:DUF333 domain-containing protein [Candidatus Uhrbacteria bacterium]